MQCWFFAIILIVCYACHRRAWKKTPVFSFPFNWGLAAPNSVVHLNMHPFFQLDFLAAYVHVAWLGLFLFCVIVLNDDKTFIHFDSTPLKTLEESWSLTNGKGGKRFACWDRKALESYVGNRIQSFPFHGMPRDVYWS